MGMKMHLENGQEIEKALLALPDKVAKRLMMKALRAGAEPVLAKAKASAPYKTGALRDGLNITSGTDSKDGTVFVAIETGKGNVSVQRTLKKIRKASGKEARKIAEKALKSQGIQWQGQYYGRMLEFGTKKMPPHPFMASALEQSQGAATSTISRVLGEGIEKEAFS